MKPFLVPIARPPAPRNSLLRYLLQALALEFTCLSFAWLVVHFHVLP